jgi:hypothetical protein
MATGCDDKIVRLFDVASGDEILKIAQHAGAVWSVCFSPDGRSIATGSSDRFARVFDVASGKEILKTAEHDGFVFSAAFSPDGMTMFTSCMDSFARVFCLSHVLDAQQPHQRVDASMMFRADRISVSSKNRIALASACFLRVLPCLHNFATDAWLPVATSLVFEWIGLTSNLQQRCFIPDSSVVRSEFLFPERGQLVLLASKWRDPEIGVAALASLCRLFRGEEPIVNAGRILFELLETDGSNELPHAAAIEALLDNVRRHISHIIRDELFTHQLIAAASIPSIQNIIINFWMHGVQLIPSKSIVALNVRQVTFSETTRMYVAPSDTTNEPVFERYFEAYPQSHGVPLNFENLLVPFKDSSGHRDGGSSSKGGMIFQKSMMFALVELGNIDIFGTAVVRAMVQHKWKMFGLQRWVREFIVFNLGLALLIVMSLRTWQHWAPGRLDDTDQFANFSVDIIVATLFCALCGRAAYRETVTFKYTISSGDGPWHRRFWRTVKSLDFWRVLNLLHIILGISAAFLVFFKSMHALPVLAVTSFLRWWGTLFYLQVRCFVAFLCCCMPSSACLFFRIGVQQVRAVRSHAGRDRESHQMVSADYVYKHSCNLERVYSAAQATMHRKRFRYHVRAAS